MRFSTTFLSGLILASLSVLEAREPTEIEQFYLELVNRARANPGAEVTRLAGFPWGDDGSPATADLNEGLSPGTITNSTKQPLAFDPFLIDAASDYSDFLLASEKFGHNENGTSRSRIEAAGYPIGPGSGWGENLATTTSTGTHLVSQARAEQHHRNLFIDFDYPGRGHRKSILNGSYREIGIAIREDLDGQSLFPPPFGNDVLSTQNFAYSSGRIFLTGVIYYDGNSDSFFTPGESA
ncbi:MAG: CAP domain-containing protein, partial [Verrucomicrobiota bacterium]